MVISNDELLLIILSQLKKKKELQTFILKICISLVQIIVKEYDIVIYHLRKRIVEEERSWRKGEWGG